MKHEIELYLLDTGRTTVEMPAGAKILSIGLVKGRPVLWAIINPDEPLEERTFCSLVKGDNVPQEDGIKLEYINTVRSSQEDVCHFFFEVINSISSTLD